MSEPELSVVAPLHDEASVAPAFVEALAPVLQRLELSFEIVLIDDGSTDDTGAVLSALARDEPRIVVVRLSRNFGKEAALSAGLSVARGDAVVLMDGDLQHPVALIPELVARWRAGADVVNAVKAHRGDEGAAYRASAWAFNRLMGAALRDDFGRQSDFKLLDRSVVDAIVALPERTRFFRGLVAWVGFQTAEVPFQVAERVGGDTSWSLTGLIRYSVRNLVAFSSAPLRGVAVAGFTISGLGLLLALQTLYNWARGAAIDGFTTTILSVLLVGGSNLLALGVVSLYLSAIYEEVKGRPLFVVRRPRSRAPGGPGTPDGPGGPGTPGGPGPPGGPGTPRSDHAPVS